MLLCFSNLHKTYFNLILISVFCLLQSYHSKFLISYAKNISLNISQTSSQNFRLTVKDSYYKLKNNFFDSGIIQYDKQKATESFFDETRPKFKKFLLKIKLNFSIGGHQFETIFKT